MLSTILKADLTPCFPGCVLFQNDLGGRIFSASYPLGKAQFYMAYFNVVRQQFFTKLLIAMAHPDSDITVASGHPLQLHAVNLPQGIFCGLTNVSYDTASRFTLQLPAQQLQGKSFRVLDETGAWQKRQPVIRLDGAFATVELSETLPPLHTLFLVVE